MNMSMVSPFFMEHGVYDNMLLSNITFLIFAILVVTLVATLTLTEHFKLLSFLTTCTYQQNSSTTNTYKTHIKDN